MLGLVTGVVAAAFAATVPVLDEESYLAIAARLDPARPYDWWRAWAPLLDRREPDAYVYAHPPLFLWWAWLWWKTSPAAGAAAVKVAAALPWAALAGWSTGRLAERLTRSPGLVAFAWLGAPVTLLGLQRGLMPDLMVTALVALAAACWLEAEEGRVSWQVLGGLALGLAAWTKYPAGLVALAFVAHRWGRLGATWPFWVAAGLPWLGGEAWLWGAYGRPHLLEVVTRAGEIARGAVGSRWLGTFARLALGVSAVPLVVRGWRWGWPAAGLLAAGLVAWGAPAGTSLRDAVVMGIFATFGIVGSLPALGGLWGDRDTRLLGVWVLVVVAGVGFGHNFSAPRYLMPAMAPMAVLLVRSLESRASGRRLVALSTAAWSVLALACTVAEHRFALATDRLAQDLAAEEPPARFAGEWTFRWRMSQAGWEFWGGDPLAAGTIVALPVHSSPPEHGADWVLVRKVVAADRFPLRVVDAPRGVGLYGDTLGGLPLGWAHSPLEEVELWRVP